LPRTSSPASSSSGVSDPRSATAPPRLSQRQFNCKFHGPNPVKERGLAGGKTTPDLASWWRSVAGQVGVSEWGQGREGA